MNTIYVRFSHHLIEFSSKIGNYYVNILYCADDVEFEDITPIQKVCLFNTFAVNRKEETKEETSQ